MIEQQNAPGGDRGLETTSTPNQYGRSLNVPLGTGKVRLPRAPTPLINRAAVRRLALEIAADTGRGRFQYVSAEFMAEVNAHTRAWIAGRIHRAPSIGKTL